MLSYLKSSNTVGVNFSVNIFKLSHLETNLSLSLFWGKGMGQGTWLEVAFDSRSSCLSLLSARAALVYHHPKPANLMLKAHAGYVGLHKNGPQRLIYLNAYFKELGNEALLE